MSKNVVQPPICYLITRVIYTVKSDTLKLNKVILSLELFITLDIILKLAFIPVKSSL